MHCGAPNDCKGIQFKSLKRGTNCLREDKASGKSQQHLSGLKDETSDLKRAGADFGATNHDDKAGLHLADIPNARVSGKLTGRLIDGRGPEAAAAMTVPFSRES